MKFVYNSGANFTGASPIYLLPAMPFALYALLINPKDGLNMHRLPNQPCLNVLRLQGQSHLLSISSKLLRYNQNHRQPFTDFGFYVKSVSSIILKILRVEDAAMRCPVKLCYADPIQGISPGLILPK